MVLDTTTLHIGIPRDENIVRRSEDFRKLKSQVNMPPNILIFGFDSVSRLGWERLLPKSHSYFANELGGIVLEGYNIVGDGTTPSLLGLLTGKMEEELPESRKGFEGAKTVDGYPWIWNDLKKLGYVTQYGEDMVQYSTFTLRLLGFQNQSTDYSYRPFGLAQDKYRGKYRYCLRGNQPQHLSQINWMRDFVRVYRDRPKFSFVFNSELTHDSTFQLPLADDDLLNLLQDFQKEGHLDNTLLILMSDHGPRFSTHRETERGRLEERNPYVGIRFPPDFLRHNPDIVENIKTNVHRLTTPFDLFATLRDFANLTMDYVKPDLQAPMKREMSILRRIPKERTCADAGILPHWCACLDWVKVPENDDLVGRAAHTVVSFINNMTASARSQCAELTLKSIESAVRFRQNDHVFKFQKSLDYHGREPDLSGTRKSTKSLYLVQMTTSPNDAIYEVTIDHLLLSNRFELDGKAVSRINKYGQQPHCVIDSHPHLRQFCYCMRRATGKSAALNNYRRLKNIHNWHVTPSPLHNVKTLCRQSEAVLSAVKVYSSTPATRQW